MPWSSRLALSTASRHVGPVPLPTSGVPTTLVADIAPKAEGVRHRLRGEVCEVGYRPHEGRRCHQGFCGDVGRRRALESAQRAPRHGHSGAQPRTPLTARAANLPRRGGQSNSTGVVANLAPPKYSPTKKASSEADVAAVLQACAAAKHLERLPRSGISAPSTVKPSRWASTNGDTSTEMKISTTAELVACRMSIVGARDAPPAPCPPRTSGVPTLARSARGPSRQPSSSSSRERDPSSWLGSGRQPLSRPACLAAEQAAVNEQIKPTPNP